MMLGEETVDTLRHKRVAIAGCDGHGGAACLTLVRMAVGRFALADTPLVTGRYAPFMNKHQGGNDDHKERIVYLSFLVR